MLAPPLATSATHGMDGNRGVIALTAVADEAWAERIAYELPELLAVPVDRGSPAYLSWLAAVVTTKN
jgi:hypothetical protein